jgi:PAS domain S-box-containing protein
MNEMLALHHFTSQVTSSLSIDAVAQNTVEQIHEVMAPDHVFFYLKDGEHLYLKGNRHLPEKSIPARQWQIHKVGTCLCGLAAKEMKPYYSKNIHKDPLCTLQECKMAGIQSFAALPMKANGSILGVLSIASSTEYDFMKQQSFLEILARHAGIALYNARLYEKLHASEQQVRAILDGVNDAIFIHDADTGDILGVNRKMQEMYGYTIEEISSLTVEDLSSGVPPYTQVEANAWMAKALAGKAPFFEWHAKKKSGALFWVEITMRCAKIGSYKRVLVVVRDISKRKLSEAEKINLEQQMQHVQKLESLGILAGGIAHDFNNILMGILGNADLAMMNLSSGSPARQNVKEIQKASVRAAELCRQMLAYSGRGKFLLDHIDISAVVKDMADMLEVSTSKKAILRYHFAENLPLTNADATQLRQVIMNLIINASEAIGDRSGIISISTGAMGCTRSYFSGTYLDENLPEGLYVYIEVADTGCGMDEDTRNKIFDPFFTTKFTGRGLGLAAALGIVRGHHGAIKVYSEPKRGTTIKILLPTVAESFEGSCLPSDKETTFFKGSGTVLLVDDEETVRSVGKQMLISLGFYVLTASEGFEALKIFRKHHSDIVCVILDLTMPRLDGIDTFREMKLIQSDVLVIMSSGYNEQEVTQRFAGKGLAGFIQKPYTIHNLQDVLIRSGIGSASKP